MSEQTARTDAATYFPTQAAGPAVEAYTISTFCRVYGVGRSFTYEEIRAGRLKIVKAGRRTLIPAKSARSWFANLGGEAS